MRGKSLNKTAKSANKKRWLDVAPLRLLRWRDDVFDLCKDQFQLEATPVNELMDMFVI